MLPDFIETARLLSRQQRGGQAGDQALFFLLPIAPTLTEEALGLSESVRRELNIIVVAGQRYDLMAACDLVMTASGTVTLELALLHVPMVVTYRFSPLTYLLGKLLVRVKYASLVNLIADREVVTELIQGDFSPQRLAEALRSIWPGTKRRIEQLTGLQEVCTQLGPPGAAAKAACLALALLPSPDYDGDTVSPHLSATAD